MADTGLRLLVVFMEEDMVYYMAYLDEEQRLYMIGPVVAEKLTFSQDHSYRRRHGITEQSYRIPYLPPPCALFCLRFPVIAVFI